MKKTILRLLSIFLAVFFLLGAIPMGVSAAEATSDFEYFVLDDGTVMLTSYIGDSVEVNIPEMVDGYTVTTIYSDCFFYKKQIEKVVIPKTIKSLNGYNDQAYVFRGNWKIKEIVVDEDNPYYSSDNGILYNKSKTRLIFFPIASTETEFTIPSSVTEIGPEAFIYNSKLQTINFLTPLSYIGPEAFNFMKSVIYFDYPKCDLNGMSGILNDCIGHIDVRISKDITAIHDMDFLGSNVTLYVYPDSYGLEWAQSHDFPYVIMEEPPIEKELVDENTGIKVSGAMDPDATLNVEKVESTVDDAVATYDITLRKDGDVIQPSGTITISIPSGIKDCKLFWVKDDGTKVEVNAIYENGNYVFTTDHLSVYALVKEPESTTVAPPETTVPEPTATEPIETTVPEPTATEPIETTVPEPTATEPIETTVPVPTVTEQVETTVAPPETTVESATDKVEPTKSVATPDTPNNNSNSGSSSGSSSASINNSSIVATGDMLGASNLLLLSIIIMSATTGVSVIFFRRKKEKVSNK